MQFSAAFCYILPGRYQYYLQHSVLNTCSSCSSLNESAVFPEHFSLHESLTHLAQRSVANSYSAFGTYAITPLHYLESQENVCPLNYRQKYTTIICGTVKSGQKLMFNSNLLLEQTSHTETPPSKWRQQSHRLP